MNTWDQMLDEFYRRRTAREEMVVIKACTPKACRTTTRLKTPEEAQTDDDTLQQFGGRTPDFTTVCGPNTIGCVFGGEVAVVPEDWLLTSTHHDFPNTGMRKSWCRVCDAEGEFDFATGSFVAK
jgi:hypothetical protein